MLRLNTAGFGGVERGKSSQEESFRAAGGRQRAKRGLKNVYTVNNKGYSYTTETWQSVYTLITIESVRIRTGGQLRRQLLRNVLPKNLV